MIPFLVEMVPFSGTTLSFKTMESPLPALSIDIWLHYFLKCFQNKSLLNQFDKCQQRRLLDANWMRIRKKNNFFSTKIKPTKKKEKKRKRKMYVKFKNRNLEVVTFEKEENEENIELNRMFWIF